MEVKGRGIFIKVSISFQEWKRKRCWQSVHGAARPNTVVPQIAGDTLDRSREHCPGPTDLLQEPQQIIPRG